MNFRLTLHVLGGLQLVLAAALLAPIPISVYYGDQQVDAFLLSASIAGVVGYAMYRRFRSRDEMTLREGFAVVTFSWISFAIFGALPYLFSGSLPKPIDAVFESMSGFATAGASVITDIEALPRSVLFWRALTHWFGGMGIIVLSVAILPLLGVGGMQLFEAEAPGPTADRLKPRIQDTARLLWGVYVLITLVGVLFLWVGEMDLFEAFCHTSAALATGGFSTRNNSVGAFGTYSQIVLMVIMILGGANFSLHYYALKGRLNSYWRSEEFCTYLGLIGGVTLIIFCFNLARFGNPAATFRDSAFTVTSILTTTGFATADYEKWHVLCQGLLLGLMFFGACTGSTSGGLKLVRLVLLIKHAYLQTVQLLHPQQVRALKLDRKPVSREIMQDVLGFTVLFLGVYLTGSLLLAAAGVDLLTAGSAVVACLSTVGPGLENVGPLDNYSALPDLAKIVLSCVMLLGRLEVSTVLVLFFRSFWKK
jgi:trk system potassium uptake protein TrkH